MVKRADPAYHAYTLEEGEAAVRAARATVEAAVKAQPAPRPALPKKFDNPAGVFTTLSTHPEGKLRGCVGFAEPVLPLKEAIVASATAAAVEDGRFEPVTAEELDGLVVEVSLLTVPTAIVAATPEELVKKVIVGRHGLIVREGRRGGLLLPQVATDWKWDAEEFLARTCQKAGQPLDFWKSPRATVLAFEAEVFTEAEPRGRVVRHQAAH